MRSGARQLCRAATAMAMGAGQAIGDMRRELIDEIGRACGKQFNIIRPGRACSTAPALFHSHLSGKLLEQCAHLDRRGLAEV